MKRRQLEAIALAYGQNDAPVVTVKAYDELAERVIELAREKGIYIAKDPHLLAMLSRLDLDQEIPPQLYAAVAVILSWAFWLKGMEPGDEKIPVPRPKN